MVHGFDANNGFPALLILSFYSNFIIINYNKNLFKYERKFQAEVFRSVHYRLVPFTYQWYRFYPKDSIVRLKKIFLTIFLNLRTFKTEAFNEIICDIQFVTSNLPSFLVLRNRANVGAVNWEVRSYTTIQRFSEPSAPTSTRFVGRSRRCQWNEHPARESALRSTSRSCP